MNLICVIRAGKNLSHTLASLKFTLHGESTGIPYLICNTWHDGFSQIKETYKYGLFIDAGTIFYDIKKFIDILANYPHQGLVGHIVDPKNKDHYYWLHPQCFFIETKYFNEKSFADNLSSQTAIVPARSAGNIHDDYTPLWIKKTTQQEKFNDSKFGSELISNFFKSKLMVANFNSQCRELKKFIYNEQSKQEWMLYNKEYLEIATNQLWIFNNEEINFSFGSKKIICPGSGFFWMQAAQTEVQELDIVDISQVQLKFVRTLLDNWDGNDYGKFVIDFMKQNSVVHYNLDCDISKIQRLKFNNKELLRNYINEKAKPVDWENIKSKKINLINENIVNFVLDKKPKADIWISNILDYKYTFLTTEYEKIQEFKKYLP